MAQKFFILFRFPSWYHWWIILSCFRWCALPDDFNEQPLLSTNWEITTISTEFVNTSRVEFISSVEHKQYPFFGIQFHPEKSAFEWKRRGYFDHSQKAIITNRYFYDTFVHFARKNNQKFSNSSVEDKFLIYNYPVSYTPKTSYTQTYFNPGLDHPNKA